MDQGPAQGVRGLDRVTDPEIRKFILEKLTMINRAFSPQHVIIFGSHSRGEARDDSDIDMVIVADSFGEVKWPDRGGLLLNTIRPDHAVDALCYTPEEFERKRKWPGIVRSAAEEGIWLSPPSQSKADREGD